MPRFFLRLSFKGTLLTGSEVQTVGCGRTDTGVHAKQFYVHFDTTRQLSDRFLYQLNAVLPIDITVQEIIPVEDQKHARYDAVERCYEYFITTARSPFLTGFAHFTHPVPDMELMNEACNFLVKQGDFSAFSKSNTQVKTNICDVRYAAWEIRKDLLVFTITADRFLRGMVRAVVGTLLEVGNTKITPEKVSEIIASRDRSEAGATVPAEGLYLSAVRYPFLEPVSIIPFPV
jgi:tRNA pseudouridine38-40 synthase